MFSFITPYIKIIKIAGILSICGLIWFVVHTINGWHHDSLKLPIITEQLKSEIACTVPSKCDSDAIVKAEESIKAVQAVKDEAIKNEQRKEAENKANQEIASKNNADYLKQLQSKLDEANLKLIEQSAHSQSCNIWLNEIIACDIE